MLINYFTIGLSLRNKVLKSCLEGKHLPPLQLQNSSLRLILDILLNV